MSERRLTNAEMAELRNDIASAERHLLAAFDYMDFDPDEDFTDETSVEHMRLAATAIHLRWARRALETV